MNIDSEPMLSILMLLPAAAWAGVIFYFSAQSDPSGPVVGGGAGGELLLPAATLHFAEYFVLAGLLWVGLYFGTRPARISGALVLIIAAAVSIAYAVGDELHQSTVDGRNASVADVLLDGTGIAAALTLCAIVTAARSHRQLH